jgi:hypothetical protein
MILFR